MEFINFLNASPSPYQAVDNFEKMLDDNGFKKISREEDWDLEIAGSYYLTINDSSLLAFTIGPKTDSFRILAAHSDSPTFRVKPKAELVENGYKKVNLEIYGSPLLSSWLDRPLSLAGRAYTKTDDPFRPKMSLVDIDKDLLVIPNAAIHLNRKVNHGYQYQANKDMLALLTTSSSDKSFLSILAEELGVDEGDILDYDLFLYAREKSGYLGPDQEFISSARLDDLAMAYSAVRSLIDKEGGEISVCYISANEEIGSYSMEGASGPLLRDSLERIAISLGLDFNKTLAKSFMISADAAHAKHPNLAELSDQNNYPLLNGGPVVKYAASKSYISDSYSASVFISLANDLGIKTQSYTNRSDIRGGITIGPLVGQNLTIPIVDVGNPTLAMHSVRELAARKDMDDMMRIFTHFYSY